jgi:hypothetical protein
MYIPVFEIKDSFIVKHKLQYNTECNDELPYKMMFIDYDLARKSQTKNAENFSGVTMDITLSGVSSIEFTYFNETNTIYLDGDLSYEDVFSSTTVTMNNFYEEYDVPNGTLFYGENETVDIEIYQKTTESGTTFWEHYAYVPNDVWTKSGSTENGYQWIVSGTTISTGYTSGYTNWMVDEIFPVLQYESDIVGTGSTHIKIDRKLEQYLYNNLIKNYDNLYYNIISLNHCNKNYTDLYIKIIRLPRSKCFNITLGLNSINFKPIYNEEEIYFNYDALNITMSGTSQVYKFDTTCLYNKYNLELFFDQLGIGGDIIYDSHTTDATPINYTFGDYYMELNVYDTTELINYSYVKIETYIGNFYNALIVDISGGTVKIITPLTYTAIDVVKKIHNIITVSEISDILQKTYENYDQGDYRKIKMKLQKNIYNTYAEIINQSEYNQEIRMLITGLIFENDKNIMVLKIFDPADFIDDRLLYEPIEIVRIGKDKKTTIPVPILDFTKGIAGDVIDENVYSVFFFDPRIYNVLVIDANNT